MGNGRGEGAEGCSAARGGGRLGRLLIGSGGSPRLGDGREEALDDRVQGAALDGDGVVGLAHSLNPADSIDTELGADFRLDERGGGERGEPAAAERLEQLAVFELGEDERFDLVFVEPAIERCAERGGADREKDRRAMEGAGKATAELFGEVWGGVDRDGGFEDGVTDGADLGVIGVRAVGENEVEVEEVEFGEEFVDAPFSADEADVGIFLEEGFEDLADDRLWDEVGGADVEHSGLACESPREGVGDF